MKYALALLSLAFVAHEADAYTLVLDVDAGTAGIQTSVSVASGTTVTVTGHLVSTTGFAAFDRAGFDLSWSKPGEGASLAAVGGALLAGSLAGVGPGPVTDLIGGGVVGPGASLATTTLGATGTNAFNLGGFGYLDGSASFFGAFGNPFGPPGTTIDVFSADFVASGAAGTSVTIDPSGIFQPGIWPPPAPLASGGDALYDGIVTLFTAPGQYQGGVVQIVPEPGRGLLALLALAAIGRRRRA